LEVIILHEQPNVGQTIIEKFERYADVAFAVVLLTPDDIGGKQESEPVLKPRARQNVIFELGFFFGRLARNHVAALIKGDVEKPSDYDGVGYIQMDRAGAWKIELARELKAAGLKVDLNDAIK
ncbi:MAG: nucleotide-binding protein, partial [Desulfobulbaceae bacterium]|nr:nucleotide-binding protein [Desulfobulbaceae bacterium]